jgi:hypothetical protein
MIEGVTTMETSVAGITVRFADPVMLATLASIPAVPRPVPDATPCEPSVLLMLATAEFDELHVTEVVKSCVLPSV